MTKSATSLGWGKDVRFRRVPGETSTIKNEEGETTGAGRFVSSSLTTNQLKWKIWKSICWAQQSSALSLLLRLLCVSLSAWLLLLIGTHRQALRLCSSASCWFAWLWVCLNEYDNTLFNQERCTMNDENDYTVDSLETALMCDELLAQLLLLFA